MPTEFQRSLRSLEADGFRKSFLGLLVAGLLLGAWLTWFFRSSVGRYEISELARLEVDQASHLVQAPMTGLVVASHLVLGREVNAGDILLELDSRPQRLQLEEERTRLRTFGPQIEAIRSEIASHEQAQRREREATQVALEEARARFREADATARHAEEEAQRLRRLAADRLIPETDLARGRAETERSRAAADSLRLGVDRIESEQRTRDQDRESLRARLRGEIQRLEGQQTTTAAGIRRLEYEIERHLIRAPIRGRLGEVAVVRVGGVVDNASKLGAVVPSSSLKIVAEFPPAAAVGRIRQGQPARLRLHGFPWLQYGSIGARVLSVADELRNGGVRVELALDGAEPPAIRLQHGLPGSVEIEVERVTPATLVLRAVGQLMASPAPGLRKETL